MLELLLTLLVIAVVFSLLVVFGGRFIVSRVGAAVTRRHDETEMILSTAVAPPTWYRRCTRLLRFAARLGASARSIAFMKDRCKRRLERRLLGLLRYIEASNVINDEDIRRTMAANIRHVGRSWEELTWEEVIGVDDEAPPGTTP